MYQGSSACNVHLSPFHLLFPSSFCLNAALPSLFKVLLDGKVHCNSDKYYTSAYVQQSSQASKCQTCIFLTDQEDSVKYAFLHGEVYVFGFCSGACFCVGVKAPGVLLLPLP